MRYEIVFYLVINNRVFYILFYIILVKEKCLNIKNLYIFHIIQNYYMGPWSSGMILPLGGRGRGFDSRRAPTKIFAFSSQTNLYNPFS